MRRIFTIFTIFLMATLLLGFTFITLTNTAVVRASSSSGENSDSTEALSPGQTVSHLTTAEEPSGEMNNPRLRNTRLISIPFGFDGPLPLNDSGQSVQVSGHGGCTQDQDVSVTVTLTQTTGVVASAAFTQTCTGIEQNWHVLASTETVTPLVAGTATACGLATTPADGDTFDWCVDVELNWQNYLPLILRNVGQ